MFEARKASCELKRREYLKVGGYHECIADENDTEQETLAKFDTLEDAKKYLEGKTSSIFPYPDNGLVVVEEFFVEEIDEDESAGIWYVAPLGENSKMYTKDIYYKRTDEEEEADE